MDENGQAIDTAPVDPFSDLVSLLASDPTSDASTDAPGRDLAERNPLDLPGLGADNQGDDNLPAADDDGPADLVSDEDIQLDPDRSLSPNGSRRAMQPRSSLPAHPGSNPPDRQGKTFLVTVKGDDGTEQTLEVNEKERGAGYLRHAQFTKLCQELAVQRAKVMEIADAKVQGFHKTALDAVQRASAIITRLAGFKTAEQMAALAAADPTAYNAELARATALREQIRELDEEAARIVESSKREADQALNEAYAACWSELERMGFIERDMTGRVTPEGEKKLKTTFEAVISRYGIPAQRFATINDPKLIHLMFDAVELGDLKARADAIKLNAKPGQQQQGQQQQQRKPQANMPRQRQHQPRQAQVNRDLEGRFSSRRGASQNDLARYILNNDL